MDQRCKVAGVQPCLLPVLAAVGGHLANVLGGRQIHGVVNGQRPDPAFQANGRFAFKQDQRAPRSESAAGGVLQGDGG